MRGSDLALHLKQRVLDLVRRARLLEFGDRVRFRWTSHRGFMTRALFAREHPGVALPPDDLAYDAYGSLHWDFYWGFGQLIADAFALTILAHGVTGRLLEWGCGPARIIRHLPERLGAGWDVSGCDANPRTVAWCAANLPGIHFAHNGPAPPLPFPSDHFDCVYSVSVFTHLSDAMHHAWMGELRRVLKPGGVLIMTLNGVASRSLLLPAERGRFDAGQLVVRGEVTEGTRCFLAYHPPSFVTTDLLQGFEVLEHQPAPNYLGARQDIWVARKRG